MILEKMFCRSMKQDYYASQMAPFKFELRSLSFRAITIISLLRSSMKETSKMSEVRATNKLFIFGQLDDIIC